MEPKRTVDINTTRGLALALPIERDQRVLVVGEGLRALVGSLQRTGAAPMLVTSASPQAGVRDQRPLEPGGRLPVEDAAADHAIVVVGSAAQWELLPDLWRVVRDGGRVLVAAPTAGLGGRRPPGSSSARSLAATLAAAGFVIEQRVGIRQRLDDVRHLVPLTGPALRWYATSAHLPTSRLGTRIATIARLPGTGRLLGRLLFRATAVAARRQGA